MLLSGGSLPGKVGRPSMALEIEPTEKNILEVVRTLFVVDLLT